MNSLREIGVFVGIPQGSAQIARWSGDRTTGLKLVSLLVRKKDIGSESLRAVIQALQNLTPITLEAEIIDLGDEFDEGHAMPVMRLNASGGIHWWTVIDYYVGGTAYLPTDLGKSGDGGDFRLTQLGPNNWQIVVSRSGISNTGFVSLSKTFTVIVPPKPKPRPEPPPQILSPNPSISVQSNGDGSFKVSGSGFVPKNATVNILVGDGTFRNPLVFSVSASDGAFRDFPTGKICQAAGNLFFSASDGRLDQGSQIFSNTVTLSCPS